METFALRNRQQNSPVERRVSMFSIYVASGEGAKVQAVLDDSLQEFKHDEPVKPGGLLWFRAPDGKTCVSGSDSFIQVRSSEGDPAALSDHMKTLASAILNHPKRIQQTGLIIRLIEVRKVPEEDRSVAERLAEKYLGFLGTEPKVLGFPLDGASTKFYFNSGDAAYELDVGPYFDGWLSVYIELESRRVGPHTASEFIKAWDCEVALFERLQQDFVIDVLLKPQVHA